MFASEDFEKMNEMIEGIFGIDSYYNARIFRILNANVYYQTIFQLHVDSLQLLLQSKNEEIAALYMPHFESFLGYLNIYKEYSYNSPESLLEKKIEEKWKKRDFIKLMKDFYSAEKPEYIIHFLGQTLLGDLPDIKASAWKFGKYPANYVDNTKLKTMLTHLSKLVDYWNEFQQFHKLLKQKYPEGINKQGIHSLPSKKHICQLLLLNPYVPDLWLDLARSSKKEKGIIIYLRVALCLDHLRYDIWKELIKYDPIYKNTNIPALDDELNNIIQGKFKQAEKFSNNKNETKRVEEIVNQAKTLKNRHEAFNEMAQKMGSGERTEIYSHTPSTERKIPSYFEYLRDIPTTNHVELFKKIENAITNLRRKDIGAVKSLEKIAQKAFDVGELDKALEVFLTIIHLSAHLGAIRNQIQATCNVGIFFSNVRRYDIARKYACEAKNLATEKNLLEEKLQALKVMGLIQTNDNRDPLEKITILNETAETLKQLGKIEESKKIEEQMKAFKQFLDLLEKK